MTCEGLTDQQALKSREKYGENTLPQKKKESFLHIFLSNFKDPMIIILLVALGINFILVFLNESEWYESVGIAAAILIATFISAYSQYENEKAFQNLQNESSRVLCKVYRNGTLCELDIEQIVVGDEVLIQSGDRVPADGHLIKGAIKVDQSVLNGESEEVAKTAINANYKPSDDINFLGKYEVFKESIVCSGNAVFKVDKVGQSTVYGQIAKELTQDKKPPSPLEVKLATLAKSISKFAYIGGIAIALIYIFQAIFITNHFDMQTITEMCSNPAYIVHTVINALMLSVVIIVMAVPEGLPLMIALVSTLNMRKMLKDNVLVRDINGIETAGGLNILFTDKTGTITKGVLEVVSFISGGGKKYKTYKDIPVFLQHRLSENSYLNTEAIMSNKDGVTQAIGGNATERAMLNFVSGERKMSQDNIKKIPFTSSTKYSAAQKSGEEITLIKGAPEIIFNKCKKAYDEDGNIIDFDYDTLNSITNSMAKQCIRVLAFAEFNGEIDEDSLLNGDWVFVGIVGIRDDIRKESVEAIKETQKAGVQVVMITGDREETAQAIAKEVGLITSADDIVCTSADLKAKSDEEIASILPRIRVIARALPSDKSRLVRIAQSLNLVVGMTGDGVNDSAALKQADIGFAMGSGTEVAKEASEIVIVDNNFKSIENAILYGRTIYNNIQKFIVYQLTINFSAVFISFVLPFFGIQSPLTVTQILWINLIMDSFAALAFGGEPTQKEYMLEKPKTRDENIITKYMRSAIAVDSLWVLILSIVFFTFDGVTNLFRDSSDLLYLYTGFFTFFVFAAVFNAFNARTKTLRLLKDINRNMTFIVVLLLIVVVQIILVYCGGQIFRCFGLELNEWIVVILLSFTIIPVDLLRKLFINQKNT